MSSDLLGRTASQVELSSHTNRSAGRPLRREPDVKVTKWHHHALWLDFNASGLDCSGLDKQLNQVQISSTVPQ